MIITMTCCGDWGFASAAEALAYPENQVVDDHHNLDDR